MRVDEPVPGKSKEEDEPPASRPAAAAVQHPDQQVAEEAKGEQSWRNLLELDAQLFKHKNVRLLTPEARVLIHLKLDGSMSVTAAMQLAGVSYRGFYAVLERLKQAGLVGQVKDREDQRVQNLSLDPSTALPSAEL